MAGKARQNQRFRNRIGATPSPVARGRISLIIAGAAARAATRGVMRLIESYIFARMLRAFVLTLVVLSATVWLSQALREFDLVSAMGQTIATFFQITLLLLP